MKKDNFKLYIDEFSKCYLQVAYKMSIDAMIYGESKPMYSYFTLQDFLEVGVVPKEALEYTEAKVALEIINSPLYKALREEK